MARKSAHFSRLVAVMDLLETHPAAAECLDRERRGDRLLARVRDLLGPHARLHCVEARVSKGILTLTLDSPSWATRVRYQTPDLIGALGDLGVAEVKTRTRPESDGAAPRQSALRLPRIGAGAVDHLLAAAEGCADPGIADAFRRLARRQLP